MRIVVTGSEGYIGSALVKSLIENFRSNVVITALDMKAQNASAPDLCKSISGDISDPDTWKHVFSDGVDVVVHLAAIPNPAMCGADPMRALKTNISGTEVALRESSRHNLLFIFVSSQTVYGGSRTGLAKESSPVVPRDLYSLTKLTGEYMVRSYHDAGFLRGVILRVSSVYGVGTRANLNQIPGKMVTDCVKRGEITLVSSENVRKPGGQVVDLVHVRDVVNAIRLAIEKGNQVAGECLNISSGRGYPVAAVGRLVASTAIRKGLVKRVVFHQASRPTTLIPRLVLSNAKTKRLLGWNPTILLREGIEELLQYA
ncbi:MAG: NAD-dependent epimerase/dehydratase family protein [Candidatus Bathyarchaeia archaeon]